MKSFCEKHRINYSSWNCPRCEADDRHAESTEAIIDAIDAIRNPGDYDCPHCLYKTLRHGASRCGFCHGEIEQEFWSKVYEREKEAREKAREKEKARAAESKRLADENEARVRTGKISAIFYLLVLLWLIGAVFYPEIFSDSSKEKNIDLSNCARTRDAYCFVLLAIKNIETNNIAPFDQVKVYAKAATLLTAANHTKEAQKYFRAAKATIEKITLRNDNWDAHHFLIDKLLSAGYRDDARLMLDSFGHMLQLLSGNGIVPTQEDLQWASIAKINAIDLPEFFMFQRDIQLGKVAVLWWRLDETSRVNRSLGSINSASMKDQAIISVLTKEASVYRWKRAMELADRLLVWGSNADAKINIIAAAAKAGDQKLVVSLVRELEYKEKILPKTYIYGKILSSISQSELHDLISEMISNIDMLPLHDGADFLFAQLAVAEALHKLGDASGAKKRLNALLTKVLSATKNESRDTKLIDIVKVQAKIGMFDDAVNTFSKIADKERYRYFYVMNDAMLDNPYKVSDKAMLMLRNLLSEFQEKIDKLDALIRAKKGNVDGALELIKKEENSDVLFEIAKYIMSEPINQDLQYNSLDQARDKNSSKRN